MNFNPQFRLVGTLQEPIGVNLSCQPAKFVGLLLFSPLKRTCALRQGFQPLPDYWLYLKLTPMGTGP
ncbi:MAG: hypothetical protein EAZ09_19280 [Oscillatoriales cyanobacterium]|nr:MAG: hypothetical protein EAZ09_19280 [Oscillatoriales cyanobacterium]